MRGISSQIQTVILGLMLAQLIPGCMYAGEIRSPMLSERGPLRYLFEQEDPYTVDNNIKVWSAVSVRQASRAFMDHGFKTKELTDLIFNKSDFKISEVFTNSLIEHKSEFYNPMLRTLHMHTKAQYTETNFTIGVRWVAPVYEDRGRVGIRTSIPFKRIEFERTDQSGVRGGAQLENVLSVQPLSEAAAGGGPAVTPQAILMRMDLAEALIQSSKLNSALKFGGTGVATEAGGHEISDVTSLSDELADKNLAAKRSLLVVRSPEGIIPRVPEIDANVGSIFSQEAKGGTAVALLLNVLPADGKISGSALFRLDKATDYSGLADDASNDVATRIENQNTKETLWFVPLRSGKDSTKIVGIETGGVMKILNDLTEQITENAFEWLHDRGFDFETTWKSGLGDIPIDFFYEHDFSDDLVGEISIGLVIPTAPESSYANNPYQAHLGNGRHWEVHVGAAGTYQPRRWINLHFDGYYSFVLEHAEERSASFAGTTIKNIGPPIKTDVDWQYFVGRIDANLFHPDTQTVSAVLGYELYWKRADQVRFEGKDLTSWLGRKFSKTASAFVADKQLLDSSKLEVGTDSIGHKFRFEASLRATDYCELFAGGSYTFAGRHIPREMDGHAGIHIVF